MKSQWVWLLASVFLLLLLTSCQKRGTELGTQTFEQLCTANGDQWMAMEPIKEGKMVSSQQCVGCMIGENHFCTVEEYVDYVNLLPSWMR